MYLTLVLFVLGVLIPSQMPVLPVLSDLIWLLVAILLALAQKATRPFVGLIVGFAYCIYSGQSWLDHKIPSTLEGIPVQVRGTITQMPLKTSLGWRIRFSVDDGQLGGRQLSLGWYDSEAPAAGETWDLRVKLSRPRGTVNPGLFDYEAWLLSQKIHGTGYVLPGANKTRLDERLLLAYFERLRQRLVKDLTNNLEPSPALNSNGYQSSVDSVRIACRSRYRAGVLAAQSSFLLPPLAGGDGIDKCCGYLQFDHRVWPACATSSYDELYRLVGDVIKKANIGMACMGFSDG
jgi:hypothetical protein